MKPLVYLACPYSHRLESMRQKRYEIATKVAGILMMDPHNETVFSPISHSHVVATYHDMPRSWAFWRKQDLDFLSCCHKMYVLKLNGWKESVGVQSEIRYARANKIPITYLDPEDFVE